MLRLAFSIVRPTCRQQIAYLEFEVELLTASGALEDGIDAFPIAHPDAVPIVAARAVPPSTAPSIRCASVEKRSCPLCGQHGLSLLGREECLILTSQRPHTTSAR